MTTLNSPSGSSRGTVVATIIAAMLAAVAAVFAAVYASNVNNRLGHLSNAVSADSVAVQRQAVEAQQNLQYQTLISQTIPKLLSPNPQDRQAGLETLLVLEPNRAPAVLKQLEASLPPDQQALLSGPMQQANVVAQATGGWGIVVGSDDTQDAAKTEVARAIGAGLAPVSIYENFGNFATVVTGFADEATANSSLVIARAKVRQSSFVVRMNVWCPRPAPASDGDQKCT